MGAILNISILTDARKARDGIDGTVGALGDLDKAASRSADTLAGIGKAAVAVGATAAVGLGALAVGAYQAAAESAKIARETERVIKTTGGAANVTAQQVGDLAGSISDLTGADDELIQGSANLLLTFTNIKNVAGEGNDVFSQATALSLDMATALGTDASGAAIQLGKALNDPIKGITALSKSGVSFTEDQKEQIKVLQESGDTLGAQKIILGELSKEFAGAAAAASTPLDHLKVQFGNVQEAIGARLIPIVDSAATWIGQQLPKAIDFATRKGQELAAFFDQNLRPALQAVGDFAVNTVLPKLAAFGQWFSDNQLVLPAFAAVVIGVLVPAFAAWALEAGAAAIATLAASYPVVLIVGALTALTFGLIAAYNNSQLFRDVVGALGATLVSLYNTALVPAATIVRDQLAVAWGELQKVWAVIQAEVLPGLLAALTQLYQSVLLPLLGFVRENSDAFKALAIVAGIVAAAMAVVSAVMIGGAVVAIGAVIAVAAGATAAFVLWISVMYRVIQAGWDLANNIKDAIGSAATFIGDKIGTIIGFFSSLRDRLNFGGLFDGFANSFRSAISTVAGIWNRLRFTVPSFDAFGVTIGGFSVGVQPIALATGGIVTSPTIALIGESGPEAVIPLDQLRGGNVYNITVETTGLGPDNPQVARDVIAAIRRYEQINGATA